MRIKEAEERTGLTAKAIRLYESKGLLTVARQTENDYRDYSEEDVSRLKTIAILRKLDVPVKTIKEWTDGTTALRDILQKAADQNREASRENELRHKLATGLAEVLKDNPDADLGEATQTLEEIDQLLQELDDIIHEDEGHVGTPLYTTLIALGPILGTIFGILDGAETDSLLLGFALSVGAVILCTLDWMRYLKTPKKERRHSGCLALVIGGVVLFVAVFGTFMWMSNVQLERYTSSPEDILLQRDFGIGTMALLVVELGVGMTAVYDKLWGKKKQNARWSRKKLLLTAAVLVLLNVVMIHGFLTGVSVATEEGIMRYGFFDPDGTFYSYSDVEQVETGFKGKWLGIPMDWTGDFYYEITYSDGVTEDWGECTDQTENDTWTWMYRLDEWILGGGAEKTGSTEYSEYCDMEQFYVDILTNVINNR